ncbi:MAG: triose-phosphate isomerase [Gemmatimonadaceae bacterium]
MQRPIFAANWKMHHGPSDARAFMRSFLAHYARRPDRKVVFFPPAVSITAVLDSLRDRQDIQVGIQNIHWEDKGAFTGEHSAAMARDAGADVALVGHSERRHVFGETNDQTARKVGAAVRAGLVPMLCVGEKLEERERGETELVVLRQLRAGISTIDPHAIASMMFAYEPVWAIGTGKTATPADASAIHHVIRRELQAILGEKANAVPILYGGSVNRGNAPSLLGAADVDGLLVGGASLDAEGWSAIVRA